MIKLSDDDVLPQKPQDVDLILSLNSYNAELFFYV